MLMVQLLKGTAKWIITAVYIYWLHADQRNTAWSHTTFTRSLLTKVDSDLVWPVGTSDDVMVVERIPSAMSCGIRCAEEVLCLMFCFHDVTSACYIISWTGELATSSPVPSWPADEMVCFYYDVWCSTEYDYDMYNGRCLKLLKENYTYTQASQWCRDDNAHLAYIKSEGDRHALMDLHVRHGDNVHSYWVGGNDFHTEGHFMWEDGTAVSQQFWLLLEPNGAELENCLEATDLPYPMLNDYPCDKGMSFVCEKNAP